MEGISIQRVDEPDGSLAWIRDHEITGEKIYIQQAPPHSIILNGKFVFLRYLAKDITGFEEVLRCQPMTGVVSKWYNTIMIKDDTHIHILHDPDFDAGTNSTPKYRNTYKDDEFWYCQYNRYSSYEIGVLQLNQPFHNVVNRLGKSILTISVAYDGIVTAVKKYGYSYSYPSVYFRCTLNKSQWIKKEVDMIYIFFVIIQLMEFWEVPSEIIEHFFHHNLFLWEVERVDEVKLCKKGESGSIMRRLY